MTEKQDLRNRLVVGRKRDGRREFDETARQELVELCLKPGVSIARTAMDHDVNPNQLRKWIASHQQRQPGPSSSGNAQVRDDLPVANQEPTSHYSSPDLPSAFVSVVATPPSTSPTSSMTLSLQVRLSNGVDLELGKAIATIDELMTLVQILGRLPCSGSMKS